MSNILQEHLLLVLPVGRTEQNSVTNATQKPLYRPLKVPDTCPDTHLYIFSPSWCNFVIFLSAAAKHNWVVNWKIKSTGLEQKARSTSHLIRRDSIPFRRLDVIQERPLVSHWGCCGKFWCSQVTPSNTCGKYFPHWGCCGKYFFLWDNTKKYL